MNNAELDKSTHNLEGLQPSLIERMKFFESYLYWFGWARRVDLVSCFQISSERAYNAIKTYKEICGENGIKYNFNSKRYEATRIFKPKIINGNISGLVSFLKTEGIPVDIDDISQFFFKNISSSITRDVCFAITTKRPMACKYLSLSSGETERTFQPCSLFYDGLKTYTRAFCFTSKRYKDFCLSRITETIKFGIPASVPLDKEWNQIETIKIVPAPGLTETQKMAIERDFCMKGGVGKIQMRKPLVFYFKKRYNLDLPHSEPARQQIILKCSCSK